MITNADPYNPYQNQKCGCNPSFLKPWGLLRGLILIGLIGGVTAAGSIPHTYSAFYSGATFFQSIRTAFLVIVSCALAASMLIFFLGVCNVINLRSLVRCPWLSFFILLDLFFMLGVCAISVLAAIAEAQVPSDYYFNKVNRGAYATAAAFGFFSTIFYFFTILASLVEICRARKYKKSNSNFSNNNNNNGNYAYGPYGQYGQYGQDPTYGQQYAQQPTYSSPFPAPGPAY